MHLYQSLEGTQVLSEVAETANEEELLRQLAEECNELSLACLKLIRVREGTTPVTFETAIANLKEEIMDVYNTIAPILKIHHLSGEEEEKYTSLKQAKAERWLERFRKAGRPDPDCNHYQYHVMGIADNMIHVKFVEKLRDTRINVNTDTHLSFRGDPIGVSNITGYKRDIIGWGKSFTYDGRSVYRYISYQGPVSVMVPREDKSFSIDTRVMAIVVINNDVYIDVNEELPDDFYLPLFSGK